MAEMSEALRLYAGVTLVTVLFLLSAIAIIANNQTVERRSRRVFLVTLSALVVISLADWFNYTFQIATPAMCWFRVTSNALIFAVTPVLPVAIARIVFPEKHGPWLTVLLVAQALLEVATVFGGFVFWVDAANVYHRGPAYPAYIFTYSVAAACASIKAIRAGRTY